LGDIDTTLNVSGILFVLVLFTATTSSGNVSIFVIKVPTIFTLLIESAGELFLLHYLPVYDKEKYRQMTLDAAETVLGFFSSDRDVYSNFIKGRKKMA
jgi:hypothetical protein